MQQGMNHYFVISISISICLATLQFNNKFGVITRWDESKISDIWKRQQCYAPCHPFIWLHCIASICEHRNITNTAYIWIQMSRTSTIHIICHAAQNEKNRLYARYTLPSNGRIIIPIRITAQRRKKCRNNICSQSEYLCCALYCNANQWRAQHDWLSSHRILKMKTTTIARIEFAQMNWIDTAFSSVGITQQQSFCCSSISNSNSVEFQFRRFTCPTNESTLSIMANMNCAYDQ